jgi:hypothetical protein
VRDGVHFSHKISDNLARPDACRGTAHIDFVYRSPLTAEVRSVDGGKFG